MLTIKRLDIAEARSIIAGARAKADAIGVPMCIAITDEGGNLIAFERMDGGKVSSITIAIDKSYTASAAKRRRMNTAQPASRETPLMASTRPLAGA